MPRATKRNSSVGLFLSDDDNYDAAKMHAASDGEIHVNTH